MIFFLVHASNMVFGSRHAVICVCTFNLDSHNQDPKIYLSDICRPYFTIYSNTNLYRMGFRTKCIVSIQYLQTCPFVSIFSIRFCCSPINNRFNLPKLLEYYIFLYSRMSENDPVIFFTKYYAMPYARAGPYVIGMMLGYILFHNRNKRVVLNKVR